MDRGKKAYEENKQDQTLLACNLNTIRSLAQWVIMVRLFWSMFHSTGMEAATLTKEGKRMPAACLSPNTEWID